MSLSWPLLANSSGKTYGSYTTYSLLLFTEQDWIEQCFTSRQHSTGYMGDGFYRSKDPTNSIKVLKEQIVHRQIKHTIIRHEHKTQQVP